MWQLAILNDENYSLGEFLSNQEYKTNCSNAHTQLEVFNLKKFSNSSEKNTLFYHLVGLAIA
jgi:hypothetical protein